MRGTHRRPAVVLALGIMIAGPATAGARAATLHGDTSQGDAVRIGVSERGKVQWLVIELVGRCSNGHRLTFWPGFVSPFSHSQKGGTTVSDAYTITGRDAATGVRFRLHAEFSARVGPRSISGTARGTQTMLASGVVCRSPRVSFHISR